MRRNSHDIFSAVDVQFVSHVTAGYNRPYSESAEVFGGHPAGSRQSMLLLGGAVRRGHGLGSRC
jgi:hypothetical protein